MILRKVSNLRPDDHVIIWKPLIFTVVRLEQLPESKICVLTLKGQNSNPESKHTLFADDLVEIVIL